MISGFTSMPAFFTSQAASKMARACISVISGIGDAETAAAVAEHGVCLVQARDLGLELLVRRCPSCRPVRAISFSRVRQELVERRVEGPDGHGQPVHHLEEAREVALLHGQELCQRLLPALQVIGHDHLAHRVDPVALEEHVLGAAQADALGAEGDGDRRLVGLVGVGPDAQLPRLVRPLHEELEVLIDRSNPQASASCR